MDPFIGQISTVAFDYAPRGWATCDGQLLAIAQNQALFSILGTTFGGNGVTTFALPDMRGRAPMSASNNNPQGANGGVETVALNLSQLPSHTHVPQAISAEGTLSPPSPNVWAKSPTTDLQYSAAGTADTVMAATASGPAGSGQAHDNMPPVQVINFIIALQGIYPPRN